MSTKVRGHHIDIRGIPVEVVRKAIKNLHIGVYPPSGRVRVAAPLWLDDEAVRLAVISRLGWIHRKRAEFAQQDRQSQREFVTGESHYFQGRRYRLDVIEHDGPPAVRLLNNAKMALRVRPGTDRDAKEAVLERSDGIAVNSATNCQSYASNGSRRLECRSMRCGSRR